MRIFTKFFCALALCVLGVVSANAKVEKVVATFANPQNTGTTWDGETRLFHWNAPSYNQLRNIGLDLGEKKEDNTYDISKFKKLVVDLTFPDFVEGKSQIRILFYQGSANKTLYATKNGVNEFIIADTLQTLFPDDYNAYIKSCSEICLSGDNVTAPGDVIVNEVYLETYDDEGEKVEATFANPQNTGTTWDGETRLFHWNAPSYNQLRNIGLDLGEKKEDNTYDISKFKKLVVDLTFPDFVEGKSQIRILFYQGSANKTLYATKNGVNEFIIADTLQTLFPDDYNAYIKSCSEICLSGDNVTAPGDVIVNGVYLETYPENESVEIPDVIEEEDPGRPEGDFTDLTADMYTGGSCIYTVGQKKAKGDFIYGSEGSGSADLSTYSKLTIVASPDMMLTLAFAGGATEEVTIGEEGIYEFDLTDGNNVLNYIRIPWEYAKTGHVWYLLLTELELGDPIELTSSEKLEGYKTFYNATTSYQVDENTSIFIVTETIVDDNEEGTATLEKVDTDIVPAGTPVILQTTAEDFTMTLTPTASKGTGDFHDNLLDVLTATAIPQGYILAYREPTADAERGLAFYPCEAELGIDIEQNEYAVYLPYIDLAEEGEVAQEVLSALRIVIAGEEATAIKSVNNIAKKTTAIYNMAGQKVNESYKGIVIKNGKKYLQK